MPLLSASRVTIVAGKGGVGKTTVTAVLARAAADAGLRVLVVELDGKPVLAELVGELPCECDLGAGGARGVPARARLRARRQAAVGVAASSTSWPRRRPGIDDIVVLGKIKQLERSGEWDVIVVDGPAAGHAITFLTSAAGLHDAVRGGPVRAQADDVAGAAPRPRPLPGRARHAARDDAGQRGRRDGLRPRGPRRRAPRAGRRQQRRRPRRRPARARSRAASTSPASRDAELLRAGGGVPPGPPADAGRRDRPARRRAGARAVAPAAAARGRASAPPTIADLAASIRAVGDRARERPRTSLEPGASTAPRSSCAAARAASARRRRPPSSGSRRRGAGAGPSS